jgi:malonate-semialdehyde dehydrogenase (acetylating)/methylmalonate-semialdehyde dehydrogenase
MPQAAVFREAPRVVSHWINGRHCEPGHRRASVFNPAQGLESRQVALGSAPDVAAAVAAAHAALPGWASQSPLHRSRLMFRYKALLDAHLQDLAQLICAEHGKTLSDAAGEVMRGIEVVEFACGAPQLLKGEFSANVGSGVDTYDLRQPLGVVAGITPFNFPAMVPLWMFPLALVCGNCFILKPSEHDPSVSLLLAELLQQAGLPDGAFNVVQGNKEVVEAMLAEPGIAAVSFVGSTAVARHVRSRGIVAGKRVQALGGAKNHMLIMPDADLANATEALAGAAYGSAGERCMAISVAVVVGDSTADALALRLRERLSRLTMGAPHLPGVEMGPLITAAHRERVARYIEIGVIEGARLLVDGRGCSVPGYEQGYFLGPTLFDGVTPAMRIWREEIFGPVLGIVRVANLDAAIELINAHDYANGTAIFTRSGEVARRFCHEVAVGMVGVNVPIPVPMAFHSFGGWRASMSGDHNVYGMEGLRFYTRLKTITQRWINSDASQESFVMPTLK